MQFAESDIKKDHYRWRLCNGTLPLYERHLRSLRTYGMSTPLESWIRARLEWTLDTLVSGYPDGVLCIDVQDDDTVTIKLEPARTAPQLSSDGELLGTTEEYSEDSLGQLWAYDGTTLFHYGPVLSATNTLTRDLARTLGYTVAEADPDETPTGEGSGERFRISDEFFVIPQGQAGPVTERLTACFDKLLSNARGA